MLSLISANVNFSPTYSTYWEKSFAGSRVRHFPVWGLPADILDHAKILDPQHIDKRLPREKGFQCASHLMRHRKVDEARGLVQFAYREPLRNWLADWCGGRHNLVDVARLRKQRSHDKSDGGRQVNSPSHW